MVKGLVSGVLFGLGAWSVELMVWSLGFSGVGMFSLGVNLGFWDVEFRVLGFGGLGHRRLPANDKKSSCGHRLAI